MQSLQYARTLRRIVVQMKARELARFLEPLLRPGTTQGVDQSLKNQFSDLLFDSRSALDRVREDRTASRIVDSLKVESIYEKGRLGRLLQLFSNVGNANQLHSSMEFFQFYSLVDSMVNLSDSCSELLEKEKLQPAENEEDILEVQLVDYDGGGIEPVRLEKLIATLIRLHTNFARLLGLSDDRLRLPYVDSGSDFVIGIQCAKQVLDGLRILFDEWWERVRFRDFETFDKRMAAVSTGLTVLGTVRQSVESHIISEEEGANLKLRVLRDVDRLIGLGASPPVHEEKVDHRQLLIAKRDIRLLGSGEPLDPDQGSPGAESQQPGFSLNPQRQILVDDE
jgi:hypothetical protein